MSLTERAAYIRGLAEGLELDADKKEAKVIGAMLELLSEMAQDVDDIGADLMDLYEVVDEIDQDLGFVEEELLGEMGHDFEEELYEILCPNCQQEVRLDEEMLISGDVVCPACGEKIEIEIDDCECGCGHDHDHD